VFSQRVIKHHLYRSVIWLFFIIRVNEVSEILFLLSNSSLFITIAIFSGFLAILVDWGEKFLHNSIVYSIHRLAELGHTNLALWRKASQ